MSGLPRPLSPYAGNAVLKPAQAPVRAPFPSPLARLRLTAAVPSKDILSVVTLSWTGQHLRLASTHSQFFRMKSEDQEGVRQFADDLLSYFIPRGIALLILRRGPGTGPQNISTGTSRMETVLQLMPFTCIEPHTQKVRAWVNSAQWMLPLPQPGFRSTHRDLQSRAIETAAYGIDRILGACRDEAALRLPMKLAEALSDAA